MTLEPKRPITTRTKLVALASNKDSVETTIAYFDGLGRPIQTVQRQASPAGKDMVQPVGYDVFGREFKKYLPYAHATATDGSFKTDALNSGAGVFNFYNTPPTGVVQTPYPFSETAFEPAPLNRTVGQGAPGDTWQLLNSTISNSGHIVKISYGTNIDSEVILWIITSGGNGATRNGYYGVGQLNTETSSDEDGHNTISYKDKNDRVVLRKVQAGTGIYYSTYYIYDDIGNLRYVIPPLPAAVTVAGITNAAVTMPASAFTEADNIFLNYIYGYHFDSRNRQTDKKIPGQGWQYTVYNKLDQPILTQDATQLNKGIWMVNKYDAQGRVIMTGEYATASSRSALQTTADGYITNLWENFTNATTNYGYTHQSYPDISTGVGNKVLTATYFDTYGIINNIAVNPSATVFSAPVVLDTLHQQPRNLPVATFVNILGTSNYIFGVNHYDTYGRSVKSIKQNFVAGSIASNKYDTEETKYNFQSLAISSVSNHYLATGIQLTLNSWNFYDHQKRPVMVKQQYISPTVTGVVITLSKEDYNEIGQSITKHLHSTNSVPNPGNSTFLQHIDYRYNSRGWMLNINDPSNLNDQTFPSVIDVFSEKLYYDRDGNGIATNIDNGNISSLTWQTKIPSSLTLTQEIKGYTFTYDPLNRLTNAVYSNSGTISNLYNESITFDELGNIVSLIRKNNSSATPLNSFAYNFMNGTVRGCKLFGITDTGAPSETQSSTYTYDTNGNLLTDTKKTVTTPITYNELNLPSLVTTGTKTIQYFYDATGKKLERLTKTGATVNEMRIYDGSIEYASSTGTVLEQVHTPEGRALPSAGAFNLQYEVADHLGNTRALFADADNNGILTASEIQQISDYYPFGREIAYGQSLTPNPDNKYKYNGKEYQQDLSEYDYGARFYDPVIARWTTVDPMADVNRRWTPYNYVKDNPINRIDPDGMIDMNDFANMDDIAEAAHQKKMAEKDGEDDPKKKKQPQSSGLKLYAATLYKEIANYNFSLNVTEEWDQWLDHPVNAISDGFKSLGSVFTPSYYKDLYQYEVTYMNAPPALKAKMDADEINGTIKNIGATGPLFDVVGGAAGSVKSSGFKFIDNGFITQQPEFRVQYGNEKLSPMKNRKVPGAVKNVPHVNIATSSFNLHVFLNPLDWKGYSDNSFSPFRFVRR
ncbi:MAG: RHS repeat-associated core domain-containing protein [Bacteroidota bacterium]|nr:RHS repeat-associated core domain-containing protein [Bacteroidota bacterium]